MYKLLTFFLFALLTFSVSWADTVTDVLTYDLIGITGTGYWTFEGKTSESSAVYAGCSAGGNNSIQLRSSGSSSGIVTTASGGKVKSITVVWNSNTQNGRTLNVYGKNSAYTTNAGDLYLNDNQGTLLGTIVKGTSTSLTVSGDYEYVGFRSASGAMYLTSISIEWETTGGSSPTTVTAPVFSIGGTPVTSNQTVEPGTAVTLTADSGNYLAYTTDGTDPGEMGNTVTVTDDNTAMVTVNSTTRIRAIALDDDMNQSSEVDFTFTVNPLQITLSPSSESATVGNTITVNVTANTTLDVIYDCASNPVGASIEEADGIFSITSATPGTYEVTFTALDDAGRTATATGTYTFTPAPTADQYSLVKSTSSVDDDGTYVLIYNSTYAMSNSLTSGYLAQTGSGFSFAGEVVTVSSTSTVDILTLENAEDGYYYIKDAFGYLQNTGNNTTLARADQPSTDNFKWQIEISSNKAQIKNKQTSRYLACNTGAQYRFTAYAQLNTQQVAASLYKKEGTNPKLSVDESELELNVPVGSTQSDSKPFTLTGKNLTGNVTINIEGDNGFVVTPSLPLTLNPVDGQVSQSFTVAYNGNASAAATITATSEGAQDVMVTVTAIKAVPSVPEITFAADPCYTDQTVTITAQDGTAIYYTTDGSEPTTGSTHYDGEFTINYGSATTVKAIAVDGNNVSNVAAKSFDWGTVTISLNPADGSFFQGSTMTGTVSVNPADAQVTVVGATYNEQTHEFIVIVSQVGGTATVQATAVKGDVSETASATYVRVAADAPSAPTFSVDAGAVTAGTELTISAPAGCVLYVNGEAYPGGSFTTTINNAVTYQAYCVNDENVSSTTVTNFYSIRSSSGSGNTYVKLTTPELVDGGTYILICEGNSFAMGNINDDYRAEPAYGLSLDKTVNPYRATVSDNNSVMVLTAHAVDGGYILQIGATDTYLSNTSSTYLVARTENSTNTWSVSGGESGCYVHHMLSSTDRGVLFRKDQTVFGAYAMSNAGTTNYDYAYLYGQASGDVTIEAPVIVPASGTYYENQQVEIAAEQDATIYYTIDGSEPNTMSSVYNGVFDVNYLRGGSTTVKAIAINADGVASPVASVTYNWGVPGLTIVPGNTNVTQPTTIAVTLTADPADGTVIYYTTDGSTPTVASAVYSAPIDVALNDVGDEVVVKAIAVISGQSTSVVNATYRYVENTVEMTDPFFSPICNHIYYGDQTVEVLCPIPGATMYYEIAEVSGNSIPDASAVARPSRSSAQYGLPIALTVGNSYYIKAVAYVGNSVSNIVEGWYIIRPTSEWVNTTGAARVLEHVSELQTMDSNQSITFRNPVQVVYMSKFTNDDAPTGYSNPIPEFCYIRDNSGYGVIYFGKAATEWAEQTSGRTTSPATIFKMGDWIDGSLIKGTTGTWSSGLIPQVGTNSHVIFNWPAATVGHTRILAEPTTCKQINQANTVANNLCGHYVHLSNTTINWAHDQDPTAADPDYRNFGRYTDGTATASMYDRFWLFSGNGQTYTYQNDAYTLRGVGDYNTDFFNYYQSKGATFDIFAIGAYYNGTYTHDGVTGDVESEILPIDYLWIYPPTILTPTEPQYEGKATITIECDTVSWSNNVPKIYYRTDEMEDWAVYEGPFDITSSTTVYSYAELPAVKADGTDYSDFVHSNVVEANYAIIGIDDPVIDPESKPIDITDGPQSLTVTITTGEGCTSADGAYYTLYTLDGSVPYWTSADDFNGAILEGTSGSHVSLTISETTTVNAVTCYVVDGEVVLMSNIESETYTFVKKNGIKYAILKDAPQVGNIVVIVNKAHNMAMSNYQNEMNRSAVGVLFTNEAVKDTVFGNDEMAQFVVESAGPGRYYLKNVNGDQPGYLYVDYSTPNLLTEAALDNEGKAVAGVSIGGYDAMADNSYIATVTYAYEGNTRYLRYYNNGHVFSTYGSTNVNEDIFLYGIEATPLAYIEANKRVGDHVVVSDQLIGAWAVVKNDGTRLLWVKDKGNQSIIPTHNDANALDYMMERMPVNKQQNDWDQSNWAIIDFSSQPSVNPEQYVNKMIQGSTVVGTYTSDLNYTIKLDAIAAGGVKPEVVDEANNGYYGYVGTDGDPKEESYNDYRYNQYSPANFLEKNFNNPWGPGAQAGPDARAAKPGTPMFFMNPKIMEIAHVWAVYAGGDRFDVYANEGDYNGFDVEGAVDVVDWAYNRTGESDYGRPTSLVVGGDYLFHVAVMRRNYGYGYRNTGSAMLRAGARGSAASGSLGIYPLDLPNDGGGVTAVQLVAGEKSIESVRYYNLMGVESKTPFDGINIVVTRYTDGTSAAVKVIR